MVSFHSASSHYLLFQMCPVTGRTFVTEIISCVSEIDGCVSYLWSDRKQDGGCSAGQVPVPEREMETDLDEEEADLNQKKVRTCSCPLSLSPPSFIMTLKYFSRVFWGGFQKD